MKEKRLVVRLGLAALLLCVFAVKASAFSWHDVFGGIKGSIKVKDDAKLAQEAKISVVDAEKTVMKAYPSAKIKSIKLDEENDYLVYAAVFASDIGNFDAKIDAGNGKILKEEKADNEDIESDEKTGEEADEDNMQNDTIVVGSIVLKDAQDKDLLSLAKISIEQAISSAQAKQAGKVVGASLDNENGFLVYSVEIASKNVSAVDVKVDAGNGKVLKVAAAADNEEEGKTEMKKDKESKEKGSSETEKDEENNE